MVAEWRNRPLHPGSGPPASMSEGRTNGTSVVQAGVPLPSSLWREVQEMPQGRQQVDAALGDVVGHSGVGTVEVSRGTVGGEREDRDGRVLLARLVLGRQVVLEGVA